MLIGGASLHKQTIDLADHLHITEIRGNLKVMRDFLKSIRDVSRLHGVKITMLSAQIHGPTLLSDQIAGHDLFFYIRLSPKFYITELRGRFEKFHHGAL